MRGKILIFLTLNFLLFSIGCERKIKNPTSPDEDFFIPPTPKEIVLKVGDQRIELSWTISDTSGIAGYRIYRGDSSDDTPALYDSTLNTQYSDRSVNNGQEYFYQISAMDEDGFEGYKSRVVSARPNLYGIIINENRKLTNSLNVSLRLIAPTSTSHMMLGNDSLFTNSAWENFSPNRSWVLEAGDGEKAVYVKYKDGGGNETSDFYQDKIILDTQAQILSLTENTQGEIKNPGDIIHFRLESAEIFGQATIDLGNLTSIKLYDDGGNGDQSPQDGIYELDYLIPLNTEMENALVVGHFRDEAGNQAPSFTAPGKVTIESPPDEPPEPVLVSVSQTDSTTLRISWSQNHDPDFDFYQIFRVDTTQGITDTLSIAIISQQTTTSYNDSYLQVGAKYCYYIQVHDTEGLVSDPSNTVCWTL